MRPLPDLNLPPGRAPAAWWVGRGPAIARGAALFALLFALAGVAGTAWRSWHTRQALQGVEEQLAALAPLPARPSPPRTRPEAAPAARADTRAWRDAIQLLNTPWPALLDALERVDRGRVAVLAVEPDARSGRIRLLAEARSLEALLAYAADLRRAPGFTDIRLQRHETLERDPAQALRLTLELELAAAPGGLAP